MQPTPLEMAYSSACFPEATRLRTIAEGGPDAARFIEVFVEVPELDRAAAVDAALVASGTTAWSLHAPFGPEVDLSALDGDIRAAGRSACRRAAEMAAALGATNLVAHPGADNITPDQRRERLAWARDSAAWLAEQCQTLGLRLAMEFLPRTCPGHSVEELVGILEGAGPTAGVCLDVNHANLGQDLVANVLALGDQIFTVHMSDDDGIDERHWLPGQGVIDWAALIGALQEVRYEGPFLYESGHDRAGGVVTPAVLRENYRRLVAPLLKGV